MNELDLMNAAGEEITYSNIYYGKCLMTFWEGKFPRDAAGNICGAPVRWNEGDPIKDRMIMVEITMDLLPGCKSNYPVSLRCSHRDRDWQKIVLPSIREAGAVNTEGKTEMSLIKDHYIKVQQVEGTKPRDKSNPDKGNWNTLKVLAIYKDEAEAINAMATETGEGPEPVATVTAPAVDLTTDPRRKAALEFCKVAIQTYSGLPEEEIKAKTAEFISRSDTIRPYVSIDDPEIIAMMDAAFLPY